MAATWRSPSGAQPLASTGAACRHHTAAALGGHAGAEAVTALAHQLARLIGPLHVALSAVAADLPMSSIPLSLICAGPLRVAKNKGAGSGARMPAYMGQASSKSMQPRRAGWPLVGL